MDKNVQVLLGIADDIIILLVIAAGIVVPLFRFKVLRKAAILASLGFVFLGAAWLVDILYVLWATYIYPGSDSDLFQRVFWVKTVIGGLAAVLGLILLIIALALKPGRQENSSTREG